MNFSECLQLPYEYRNPLEKTSALSISCSRSDSDKLRRWWCMVNAWCRVTRILSPYTAFLCRRNTTADVGATPFSMSIEYVGRMQLTSLVNVTLPATAFERFGDWMEWLHVAAISIECKSFVLADASELNNSIIVDMQCIWFSCDGMYSLITLITVYQFCCCWPMPLNTNRSMGIRFIRFRHQKESDTKMNIEKKYTKRKPFSHKSK